jgi:hypothetical protein
MGVIMSQSATPHDTLFSNVYVPAFQSALAGHGWQLTAENAPRILKIAEQLRLQHDAQQAATQASGGDLLTRAELKLAQVAPHGYAQQAANQVAQDNAAAVNYLLTQHPAIAEAAAQML